MDDDKKQQKYSFCIEVDRKPYQCERTVTGTRALTQSVTVRGVGTESDPADYGSSAQPVISMEGIATLIATRIVRKNVAAPA
jgi:hypothetical protein